MAIRKNRETNAVLTRLNSELQQQLKVGGLFDFWISRTFSCKTVFVWVCFFILCPLWKTRMGITDLQTLEVARLTP